MHGIHVMCATEVNMMLQFFLRICIINTYICIVVQIYTALFEDVLFL